MDLFRLVGRVVIASMVTGIIAVPLMFLLFGSMEQMPLISIVILILLLILVVIKTFKKNK